MCQKISVILEMPALYEDKLDAEDILVAQQGLMLGFNVRISENSELFLNILPFCIMHRTSLFFESKFGQYLTTLTNDRFNKEVIYSYKKESKVQISDILLNSAVRKHASDFERYNGGGDYSFVSCGIADLEAEYIRLPQSNCIEWARMRIQYNISNIISSINSLNDIFYGNISMEYIHRDYHEPEELLKSYKDCNAFASVYRFLTDRSSFLYYNKSIDMKNYLQNYIDCKYILER